MPPCDEQYDEVHALTRKTDARPGCYDRPPFKPGRWVQDGWIEHRPTMDAVVAPHRTPRWVWVPHRMSGECRTNIGVPFLDECTGCVWTT